jgi:GAF domain-containing protein
MAASDQTPGTEHLQDLLLDSPGFTEFLLGLSTISASVFSGEASALCAINVERDGGPTTVASSTTTARKLDERQYSIDDGPCLTALREQHTVMIPDLAADSRWHRYAEAVAPEGVRSVLAVPIPTDDSSSAALNCYSLHVHAFSAETVARVEAHARSLSRILRLAMRVHAPDPYPEHLRNALKSREVVDAAVALVMAQNRCNREEALNILQLASRHHDRQVHTVAEELLKGAAAAVVISRAADEPVSPGQTGRNGGS